MFVFCCCLKFSFSSICHSILFYFLYVMQKKIKPMKERFLKKCFNIVLCVKQDIFSLLIAYSKEQLILIDKWNYLKKLKKKYFL